MTKSVKGLNNYYPKEKSIEFMFDPKQSTFVVGKGPKAPLISPHESLARVIGADPKYVVGGMFKRGKSGEFFTNEFSGQFWQNWNPAVRQQFTDFMKSKDVVVIHSNGMSY